MRNKSLKSTIRISLLTLILIGFHTGGCKKGVLVSPENTTLLVTVNPNRIPVGGEANVRVLARKESGTPVADGTIIYFSADMGTIESSKETHDGIAEALFKSNDNRSGVANIIVTSGNAKMSPDSVKITIGSAALKTISLSAYPSSLPRGGGDSSIKIKTLDENGNTIPNIPVLISTTSGELRSNGNTLVTDSNGYVEDLLHTKTNADITATSGSIKSEVLKVVISSNSAPVPVLESSPTSPKVGETIYFNASRSTDPDGSITSYSWDFGDGAQSTGQTVTHAYAKNGTYKVTLSVTDDSGLQASTSSDITVSLNEKPTAKFFYSPTSPIINTIIQFNASESIDKDGSIVKYEWDFGDSTPSALGIIVSHKYSIPGTFKVRLIVTDDKGNIGIAEENVAVTTGKNPIAQISYVPQNPRPNETVHFSGSNSTDADGYIAHYSWDFGDGASDTGENTTHSYSKVGLYHVILTVKDNENKIGIAGVDIKVISKESPTAKFTYIPSTPLANKEITFDATTSSDPDGVIEQYSWDFGDNTPRVEGKVVGHTFKEKGTYTVILTVIDNDGLQDSAPKSITVN